MSGQLRFPNINQVVISGRLTRDVEMRFSASGMGVANFCIAIDRREKDEQGNYQNVPNFFDVVAFDKQAQICQESLKKGSPVIIDGTLRIRSYTDKSGNNRKVTEIIASRIYPLERDENYMQNNPNYQGYNNYPPQNNGGYAPNQQVYAPPPQQNPIPAAPPVEQPPVPQTAPVSEPDFPTYEQPVTNHDVTTQDDVPF